MARNFEAIMKKFLEYYESQEEELFVKEFMTLKSYSQKYKETNKYPSPTGLLPINKKKNRFKDILPYEHTRVELHPVEGCEGSDYINANYIQGADGEINYIAAQGPLPTTILDFWRMIWYHNIEIVVMACREVEMGKHKCERYWPTVHQSITYGAIKITTSSEENVSNDFVVRDLTAECLGETQVIRQYHYNAWPDHGKPDSPDPIIRMIELMNDYRKNKEIPIVIHCSAGCGRTGTMIGIDIAKIQLSSKNVNPDFSVFKIVEKMRQQRPAMVQAKDQYTFVYMAIAELAQRSLGFNPTLPPKPVTRATVPAGKSYINIDTGDPQSVTSPVPTATSHNGSTGSPSPTDSEDQLYQNVANSRPTNKRSSGGEGTEIGTGSSGGGVDAPKEPPPTVTRRPGSGSNSGVDAPKEPPPVVNRRPPEIKQRSISSNESSGSSIASTEKKSNGIHTAPSPKPRARKNHKNNDNGATPPLPPLPSTTATTTKAPPPIAGRPPKQEESMTSQSQQPPPAPPPKTPERHLPSVPPTFSSSPRPQPPQKPHPTNGKSSPLPPPPALRSPPTKSLAPAPQQQPPPPPQPQPPEEDSVYSFVDLSVITDTGPEITIESGGVVGGKWEEEDDPPPPPVPPMRESPVKKSNSSIMDTFEDIFDEDIFDTIQTIKPSPSPSRKTSNISSRPLPSVPPGQSFDEPPPAVPTRTDARLELVNDGGAPTYDIPDVITTNDDMSVIKHSNHSVPENFMETDYEQPTPLSIPVGGKSNSSVQNKPLPSPVLASSSTAASIATMNRNPQSSSSSSSSLLSNKLGSFFHPRKSKRQKKDFEASLEDLTSSGNNGVKHGTSSSSSSNSTMESSRGVKRTSPSISSLDDKYRFPGSLGFGVRVDRPVGPRDEPPQWKNSLLPSAIRVT